MFLKHLKGRSEKYCYHILKTGRLVVATSVKFFDDEIFRVVDGINFVAVVPGLQEIQLTPVVTLERR